MHILVTGATGFVGSALLERLALESQYKVTSVFRQKPHRLSFGNDRVQVGELLADTDWSHALCGIDVVIHAAARVHVMQDTSADPLVEYRRINVAGSLNLARQAVSAGVQRFVFISSIKVNGEATPLGQPYTANDLPAPADPYAVSKYEAEEGLQQLAGKTGMDVVIIRPPLIYGSGVKANFQSMMYWLGKGVPLPFGAVDNKRSFVALDNLVDLIVTCIDHPAAANQIFLASDGKDLSTTELLQRMAKVLGKPARLIPVPVKILELVAAALGKRALAQRLCESLQVDISKAQDVLGWTPPISVDEGLRRAAAGYKLKFFKYTPLDAEKAEDSDKI